MQHMLLNPLQKTDIDPGDLRPFVFSTSSPEAVINHSKRLSADGHLAIYDSVHRAVFVGDALHGRYCPAASGEASLPPAYYSVLAYLGTLPFLEALDIEWIYSGHWPTFHGSQVSEFLVESRRFVDSASSLVWRALERHKEGVTLSVCIEECGPALGSWPASNRWLLMYPMHGHLLYLEQQGLITRSSGERLVHWKMAA